MKFSKIPTNLITGFLGVGKTTTILNLLKRKPEQERWLVLVNEFGEVPIDQILMQSPDREDVNIRYVAGGCICCTANLPLQMSLTLAIRQVKPHRILIEPTGIGHPAQMIDILQGRYFKDVLDLRATICLVNPTHLANDDYTLNETWIDQVMLADVLIANKIDLVSDEKIQYFWDWAKELYPPKLQMATVSQGEIDLKYLDIEVFMLREAQYPHAHEYGHHQETAPPLEEMSIPLVGEPIRKESEGFGRFGCGWVFSPDEAFDWYALKDFLLELPNIQRIKGVFHTVLGDRMLVNMADGHFWTEAIAYRRDSRVEFIATTPQDWKMIHKRLEACIWRGTDQAYYETVISEQVSDISKK